MWCVAPLSIIHDGKEFRENELLKNLEWRVLSFNNSKDECTAREWGQEAYYLLDEKLMNQRRHLPMMLNLYMYDYCSFLRWPPIRITNEHKTSVTSVVRIVTFFTNSKKKRIHKRSWQQWSINSAVDRSWNMFVSSL